MFAVCLVLELLCLCWGTCALVSLLQTDLSHCRGSSAGVLKGQASSLACLQVCTQGCLFLELSASHNSNIHFLRVTRGGRPAWGSVGTWHAFSTPNGPRFCLRSFSCCLGARLRDLTFDVDPRDPRRMIDGTGRALYYKGIMRMHNTAPNPHRRLQAITAEDDEWIVL